MPRQHPWDEAAQEVVQWLNDEPAYYAEALRGGHAAPFSASTTEDQKLDYYRRQVFHQNLDGTPDFTKPNEPGRRMLIDRLGINGYTQVMAAVMPRQVVAHNVTPSQVVDKPEPMEIPNAPEPPEDIGSY